MAYYELLLTGGRLPTHIACAFSMATLAHCFNVLTWPSLRIFQIVSSHVSRSIGSFCVLTSPSLGHLQDVSGPCSVGFFLCSDNPVPLPSPEREWALLSRFLYVF